MKLHSIGAIEADVTAGSADVWERLHDDSSGPHRVEDELEQPAD